MAHVWVAAAHDVLHDAWQLLESRSRTRQRRRQAAEDGNSRQKRRHVRAGCSEHFSRHMGRAEGAHSCEH
jgi:hypothetical protein